MVALITARNFATGVSHKGGSAETLPVPRNPPSAVGCGEGCELLGWGCCWGRGGGGGHTLLFPLIRLISEHVNTCERGAAVPGLL